MIYDARSYEFLRSLTLPSHLDNGYQIYLVAWSRDETRIATGSLNGAIQVWDADSGDILRTWFGSEYDIDAVPRILIYGLVFSQSGHEVVAIRGDGALLRWNMEIDTLLEEIQLGMTVYLASISPYGGRIAVIADNRQPDPFAQEMQFLAANDLDIQIIVPFPSLDRVRDIGAACLRDATDKTAAEVVLNADALAALDVASLAEFAARVEALPDGVIPLACEIDLLAVAGAVE